MAQTLRRAIADIVKAQDAMARPDGAADNPIERAAIQNLVGSLGPRSRPVAILDLPALGSRRFGQPPILFEKFDDVRDADAKLDKMHGHCQSSRKSIMMKGRRHRRLASAGNDEQGDDPPFRPSRARGLHAGTGGPRPCSRPPCAGQYRRLPTRMAARCLRKFAANQSSIAL
jgi:hypothetical protein